MQLHEVYSNEQYNFQQALQSTWDKPYNDAAFLKIHNTVMVMAAPSRNITEKAWYDNAVTKTRERCRNMHNKLIVGSMTAALLFGGAFQSTADASASTANAQNSSNQHKVYYSMNGSGMGELSSGKFQEYVKQYFPQVTWNWESQNSNNEQEKQEKPEQEQEQSEPEQQPESNKPESNQEQSDNNTPSEPQQNEATEQVPEQQEEQPARTPEAQTPQQPAEQKEQQQKPSQSQQLNEFEQQVVELTNQERTAQGLEPLKVDTELSKVAREKSRDMAANNYFSHDSPNYGSPLI